MDKIGTLSRNLLSRPSRLAAIVCTTFAVGGILLVLWRLRRKPGKAYHDITDGSGDRVVATSKENYQRYASGRSSQSGGGGYAVQSTSQANGSIYHLGTSTGRTGTVPSSRRSVTPTVVSRSPTVDSVADLEGLESCSTTMTIKAQNTKNLAPEQLFDLGFECLQSSISYWEEALDKISKWSRSLEDEDVDDDGGGGGRQQLEDELRQLLERATQLKELHELRLFNQLNTDIALDMALQEMNREYEMGERRARSMDESSSDQDSFVSAADFADVADVEESHWVFKQLALYHAAILELQHGNIPYRLLRTKTVGCTSDSEFLAKLYCVRLAFEEIFKQEEICELFETSGRKMLSELLVKTGKDAEDFHTTFNALISFVRTPQNWPAIEEELNTRGVKVMNFYDIVIDFILFDAFDDLDNLPSSVATVVRNRWLTNGFKETALSTAVWSVLKAKRRMLKFPDRFISRFYTMSEHTSPVLAWGFLGPAGLQKDLCVLFKEQILEYVRQVFSFARTRFTTIEQMSEDIIRISKERAQYTLEQIARLN